MKFSLCALAVACCAFAGAQNVLSTLPRYARYQQMRSESFGAVQGGSISADWEDDSKGFTFFKDGRRVRFDVGTKAIANAAATHSTATQRPGRRGGMPERGRQFESATSPDGKHKATSRDRNMYVSDADGGNEVAITTDGDVAKRIKYGTASWVYGEELDMRDAMWWSPDGTKLAFYRFDESPVKDYYLQYNQVDIQDVLNVEAYPKAGAPNPVVTLLVYDLPSKKLTTIDTHFGDATLGEYVYDVKWTPDGKSLLFNRTNRKQNVMELCLADPNGGTPRAVVRESQPQSWAENHPIMQFLSDGKRFIWGSERTGYRGLYVYDLSGKLLSTIKSGDYDIDRVVRVDEKSGSVWYTARSGENAYLDQLHRASLDGAKMQMLTDPRLSHSVSISPDGKYFTDIAQSVATPPITTLRDADGKSITVLGTSDTSKFDRLGLKRVERVSFLAADGKTRLYGKLSFPSDFDPSKKYPLVVSVYGGPESGGEPETFSTPPATTELGFLMVEFEGRGTMGRGKAFRDAVYGKLGVVEIDDQDAGVKDLCKRPYVDAAHVGIYGTSYGGYFSTMAILRHPETFAAACASSPVTDWRNYDTIYTERFMGLPGKGENEEGYRNAAAATYARDLKGKLMLYYGTADNNVHPSNTLQLIAALSRAGRPYDLQVGPDQGHSGMNASRMWEYFVANLDAK